MSLLRNIASGLRSLFRKEQVDRELDEELRAYQEMATEEKMKQGMSRRDALRTVRLERGSLEVCKEIVHSGGWEFFVETCWQDLRFAARMLRKSPGFTAVAVLTLALGIGASTAIFSVVESVLWRPLPFPDSQRLTAIWSTNLKQTWRKEPASPADYLDWRTQSTVFDALGAFEWSENHTLTGDGDPERVQVMPVSANFFDMLQVRPLMGRVFHSEEEKTGKSRVALISHSLWERRFHSNPNVIGKAITLDGEQYAIVGVCTSRFHLEFQDVDPDLYIPLTLDASASTTRADRHLGVIGRLKPNTHLTQVSTEMTTVAERLAQQYPKEDGDWRVQVENLRQSLAYPSATSLLFFFVGAVALLFLIACVNVANLLLSRGLTRQREFAVRTVLGAGRAVLLRQLLVESFILAACGGAAGTLLASWGVRIFAALLPSETLPRAAFIRLDARVFAFAVALSFATAILFGLIPALFSSKVDPNSYLKEAARSVAGGFSQARARNALVAAQVAIALVLLFGAGLFVNSFLRLERVSLGFDPSNILSMRVDVKGQQYSSPEKVSLFYKSLLERIRGLPGVGAAVAANAVPLTGGYAVHFAIAGQPRPASGEEPFALNHVVTANYFRVMKIRVLAGRDFDDKDTMGAPAVAIVNERFVRHFFPNEEALGKELEIVGGWEKGSTRGRVQIVGVVASTKEVGLNEVDFDSIYFPFLQNPTPSMFLVLSASIPGSGVAGAVRKEVLNMDKDQPVFNVISMEQRVADALHGDRFNLILIGSFAGFAVLLASVGVYGAISYLVEQRTQEFGIRMALGASREAIYRLTLGKAGVLSLSGLLAGVAASLALGRIAGNRLYLVPRVHSGLLYGVSVFDPLTLAIVFALLAAVALLASYLPARRATKVNPMVALRYE